MKFYGRYDEIRALSEHGHPFFIVLWGRRRIGKTSLALEAFKDPLYFFVGRKSPAILLEEFTEVVRKGHGYIPTFKNWDEFLIYLMKECSETIIFDEFQNFHFSDPSFFSTMQKILDNSSNYGIVVVGSYVGMMKKIFMDSKEPLFGRTTGSMRVTPLPFPTICRILEDMGIHDIREKITIYSVFGGIPYHYVLMEGLHVSSFRNSLERLVFSQIAPLKSEVKSVLLEEFGRNYTTYFSILQSIASGCTTLTDISNSTGILVQSLGKYLQELVEVYDIIERAVPIGGSRKGIYRIKDPFTRFWFRYVESHLSDLESGRFEYPLRKVIEDLPLIASYEFESIVRDLIGTEFNKVGRWWNRSGEEIDVVALDDENGRILFGEVKWTSRKVGMGELSTLKARAELVKAGKGYERIYLLASRSGFKNIDREKNTLLWSLKDIEKMAEEKYCKE